jgi:hypothetical protein
MWPSITYQAAESGDEKSGGDSCDGTVTDLVLAEEGVKTVIHDGDAEDNENGIKIVHQVVRGSVRGEHCCQETRRLP